MSSQDRPEPAETDEQEDGLDPGAAAPEAADASETDSDAETFGAEMEKWKHVAMRTAADLENFRKRAAREREESLRYANQSLLEELLPVLDNFEMGMQAAEQEKGSMIYVGMDMVRKQLADFLANLGVKEVEAAGQAFDPNLHEAVSQEESADQEEGTVLRVTRRGFMLRDRLLRPASVVVASGSSASESGDEGGADHV